MISCEQHLAIVGRSPTERGSGGVAICCDQLEEETEERKKGELEETMINKQQKMR